MTSCAPSATFTPTSQQCTIIGKSNNIICQVNAGFDCEAPQFCNSIITSQLTQDIASACQVLAPQLGKPCVIVPVAGQATCALGTSLAAAAFFLQFALSYSPTITPRMSHVSHDKIRCIIDGWYCRLELSSLCTAGKYIDGAAVACRVVNISCCI